MPDLSSRLHANAATVTLLDQVAQAPGTIDGEAWTNVHAAVSIRFYLNFYAGALAVGQTLDVILQVSPEGIPADFVSWFQFAQLTNGSPPQQRQIINTDRGDYGTGVVSNAAYVAGVNSFFPAGSFRVRGVLSAGAGTPSYRVLMLCNGS